MLELSDGNLKFRDARRRKISPEYRNFPDTELFTSRDASPADFTSAGQARDWARSLLADREKSRGGRLAVPRRVI